MIEKPDLSLSNLHKKYRVIYSDPPWQYLSYAPSGMKKSAQNHYDCMSIDDLKSLPVSDIAQDNAIMFMWVTDPLLPKQIEVMESWGFSYRTMGFVWIKMNKTQQTPFFGLGYYTRKNCEYVIIGVKGKIGRPLVKNVSMVIQSKIREHSRKPDEIYPLIESMYSGPYIELFARQKYPNWDSWGNEISKFEPMNCIDNYY